MQSVLRTTSNASRYAVGGDFELPAVSFGPADQLSALTCHLAGTWTASGRAALALVLRHLQSVGVRRIQLPAYLCESILRVVQASGLEYSFYPVDADLTAHPEPERGAAVFLIHYFGWIHPAAAALRSRAGKDFYLIEDAAQALLSDWSAPSHGERFVLLSPRKFGPAPLGGWCNLAADLPEPSSEVQAVWWRSLAARLVRGMYLAEPDKSVDEALEAFYLSAFQAVETFLSDHVTEASVPQAALEVMAGIDWEAIAAQRRANWKQLNELLGNLVQPLFPALPDHVVPLGYAVRLPKRDAVRARLAERRIFCPVHWPLPGEINPRHFPEAAQLAESCLTIPIDQRYGPRDIQWVADTVKKVVQGQ